MADTDPGSRMSFRTAEDLMRTRIELTVADAARSLAHVADCVDVLLERLPLDHPDRSSWETFRDDVASLRCRPPLGDSPAAL